MVDDTDFDSKFDDLREPSDSRFSFGIFFWFSLFALFCGLMLYVSLVNITLG